MMSQSAFDSLSLVDSTGRAILASTVCTLLLGLSANVIAGSRYSRLAVDLQENALPRGQFRHEVLNDIVREVTDAARRSRDPNAQAIIEDRFHSDLKPLLLAERFVRAATGLVIILGLLGTFYGLTSSIGKLVQLVGTDPTGGSDIQGVTSGLTQALAGMTVAFSNSLVGIASAVVLTGAGVFLNLGDRRVALMIRIETYLDRLIATQDATDRTRVSGRDVDVAGFGESIDRLERVVGRFETSLQNLASGTRDFTEFNAHLKDNIQRMSVSFADVTGAFQSQIATLKRGEGR